MAFHDSHTSKLITVKVDGMIRSLGLAPPDILKYIVNDNAADINFNVNLTFLTH